MTTALTPLPELSSNHRYGGVTGFLLIVTLPANYHDFFYLAFTNITCDRL
ncbi:MAG TPA: hypothetical protein V6C78_20105 [Crinalium sp.]